MRLDPTGRLSGQVLRARVDAAAIEHARRGAGTMVVASGGRRWGEHVEADVIARELATRGVPASAIVRERSSLSTRDNARFAAEVLARRGIRSAAVVTSDWHLPRALALFRRAGLVVRGVPACPEPRVRAGPLGAVAALPARVWRAGRERLLTLVDLRLGARGANQASR
ncbi:MAG: YdcF family protein [Myxococcales bacterium]|nr:YdcF family protein [Myxococcales bacterium]